MVSQSSGKWPGSLVVNDQSAVTCYLGLFHFSSLRTGLTGLIFRRRQSLKQFSGRKQQMWNRSSMHSGLLFRIEGGEAFFMKCEWMMDGWRMPCHSKISWSGLWPDEQITNAQKLCYLLCTVEACFIQPLPLRRCYITGRKSSDVTCTHCHFFSNSFPVDAPDNDVLTLVTAYLKTSNLLYLFSLVVNGQSCCK